MLFIQLKTFRIGLVYPAKSTELTLVVIIITMVISILVGETRFAHLVYHHYLAYTIHGKRQPGDPGISCFFIFEVKESRRLVFDLHLLPHIVFISGQDMRLLSTQ